jgi:hypothetical protein
VPYVNPNHRGLAYGDGYMQGDGKCGQIVALVGDDLFAVNKVMANRSFGILIKDCKAGEMPGIFCMGGIYETDVFETGISAGDDLVVSTNGKLTSAPEAATNIIGQVLSVSNGILKFRLLI